MIKINRMMNNHVSKKLFLEYLDKYNQFIKEDSMDANYLLDKAKFIYFHLKNKMNFDLEHKPQIIFEILSTITRAIFLDSGLCIILENFDLKLILEDF